MSGFTAALGMLLFPASGVAGASALDKPHEAPRCLRSRREGAVISAHSNSSPRTDGVWKFPSRRNRLQSRQRLSIKTRTPGGRAPVKVDSLSTWAAHPLAAGVPLSIMSDLLERPSERPSPVPPSRLVRVCAAVLGAGTLALLWQPLGCVGSRRMGPDAVRHSGMGREGERRLMPLCYSPCENRWEDAGEYLCHCPPGFDGGLPDEAPSSPQDSGHRIP